MDKIREDVIKKWESLGLLNGLKGHIKENVAELFECCKSIDMTEYTDNTNKFTSPGIPIGETDGQTIKHDLNQDYRLPVKFVNESNNVDPQYESDGASGFDLRASLTEPMVLKPLKRALIPTGLYFELLPNIEIQVRPRSGLAIKKGVTVLNSPGTVDSDYRGEVKVILINLGEEDFTIENGDRIAQGVVSIVNTKKTAKLINSKTIDKNTERGAGGFGSTGVK
jgi:dUTP pyrophosphatase